MGTLPLRGFAFEKDGRERAGLAVGDELFDLTWLISEWPGAEDLSLQDRPSLGDIVRGGLFSRTFLEEIWEYARRSGVAESARLGGEIRFLPPVTSPQKILCLGRNYAAHARESGHDVPSEPIFFAKAPSSLIGHGQPIVLPKMSKRVDHEAELAVVIGRAAKRVSAKDAWETIAGYTIVNDVTARDIQKADIDGGKPWFRSKSFDTFCPCGPWLVPRESVSDPHQLVISLRVNGEERQHASTAEMIFKIPTLVEYISAHMTLMPGDIISTGTPEGISPLKPGDVVEITIDGIGTLRNPVVAEKD